jgi:hypothetical protein
MGFRTFLQFPTQPQNTRTWLVNRVPFHPKLLKPRLRGLVTKSVKRRISFAVNVLLLDCLLA